jgi:hypothetical protein
MNKLLILFILFALLVSCNKATTVTNTPLQNIPTLSANKTVENGLPKTSTPPSMPSATVTQSFDIVIPSPSPSATGIRQETPTPYLSATATTWVRKVVTLTPSAAETNQTMQILPDMPLFLWGGEIGSYTRIDLAQGEYITFPSGKYPTTSSTDKLAPAHAVDLAFSQYSRQVAYLTSALSPETEGRELWIADLDLQNIQKVWKDDNLWLGDIKRIWAFHESQMTWGVNDRYIILVSNHPDTKGHIVVFDTQTKSAYLWIGSCNLLARSSTNGEIEVWCTIQLEGIQSYALLSSTGVRQSKQPPKLIIADAQAWRFSPDGKQVLYLDKNSRWHNATSQAYKKALILPVTYTDNPIYTGPDVINLQWTLDSKRVLVYGLPNDRSLCPQTYDTISGYNDRPCWFIFDAETGKIVWRPTPEIGDALGAPIEHVNFDYNMAISPDGKWLAASVGNYYIGQLYQLLLISLADGKAQEIIIDSVFLPAYYLAWGWKGNQ